ncbi:SUF system Fe-S cluster assembly protein [Erythrobacter crassostreae]|uniref:SUF system Fe-S cluster assembly protein n=1 Tax=Erythrobacter crassostreae TaxID=2828328 RepID=A0A9X1JLS2_9SPHN|nr:SUF system Fe-S cluster assembly protein [Erythrobacter crassostrea]MBV7258624.1 SUF system Fe-S cluster assembly protein [Erythrobacter crassostrea]
MNKPQDETEFVAAPAPNDEVVKPPRARVADVIDPDADETPVSSEPRKRDYLDGFLHQQPAEGEVGGPGSDLQTAVVDALKEIYDPEIPVNIYDLGLIYGVDVDDEADATITMTLTTPHCPVAETMPGEVELRAASVPGIRDAEVNLVWDPPWSPEKMTDEARLELGML